MRKIWVKMLVCVVVVAIGTSFAWADDAPEKKERKKGERPSAEAIFKKLDADSNGKITLAELMKSRRYQGDEGEAKANATLAKMDADKSGDLCVKEFTEGLKKAMEGRKGGEGKKGEGKKGGGKRGGGKKGEKKSE